MNRPANAISPEGHTHTVNMTFFDANQSKSISPCGDAKTSGGSTKPGNSSASFSASLTVSGATASASSPSQSARPAVSSSLFIARFIAGLYVLYAFRCRHGLTGARGARALKLSFAGMFVPPRSIDNMGRSVLCVKACRRAFREASTAAPGRALPPRRTPESAVRPVQ